MPSLVAANVILLDRVLAHHGQDSQSARDLLRRYVSRALDQRWPTTGSGSAWLDLAATGAHGLYETIRALSPQTATQRALRAEAYQITIDLGRTCPLLTAQGGSTIPPPFLVILTFWATVLFASFGFFAPRNVTVAAVLLV